MNSLLTQLGVGGILVILVLREVFNFLKQYQTKKKNGNGERRFKLDQKVDRLQTDMNTLLKLHDGTKNSKVAEQVQDLWYERAALKEAIDDLAEATKEQTKVFQEICVRLQIMKEN